MTTLNNTKTGRLPVINYLQAGLLAGLIGGLIASVYYYIYQAISGRSYAELNILTIMLTALLVNVVGSLVYYGLVRYTQRNPTSIFRAVGLIFGIMSALPNFLAPPNLTPGFAWAASPMHLIVALSCLLIVPRWLQSRS